MKTVLEIICSALYIYSCLFQLVYSTLLMASMSFMIVSFFHYKLGTYTGYIK